MSTFISRLDASGGGPRLAVKDLIGAAGGRERAENPDMVDVRVRVTWLCYSDYRTDSVMVQETTVAVDGW